MTGRLHRRSLGALVFSVRAIGDVNGSGYADVIAGTQCPGCVSGDMFCLEGTGVVVGAEESAASSPPRLVAVRPNPTRSRAVGRARPGSQEGRSDSGKSLRSTLRWSASTPSVSAA